MGPAGEPGPQGPAGPGAVAIRYFAHASATPTWQTAFDFNGVKLAANCLQDGAQTVMGFSMVSAEAAVIHDHFGVDFGTDPHGPGSGAQTGTLLIELQPNVEVSVAQPAVDGSNFFRAVATLVYVPDTKVMTMTAVTLVNAADQTCQLMGSAIPTT